MGLAKMQVAVVALLMVAGCAYRLQNRDSRARAVADTVVDESSLREEVVDEDAIQGAHGKAPKRRPRIEKKKRKKFSRRRCEGTEVTFRENCMPRVMRCDANCDGHVAYDKDENLVLREDTYELEDDLMVPKKETEAMVMVCKEGHEGNKTIYSLRSLASHHRLGAGHSGWIGKYSLKTSFKTAQMRLFGVDSFEVLTQEKPTPIELGWYKHTSDWHSPVCVWRGHPHIGEKLVSSDKCANDDKSDPKYQDTASFRFLDPEKHGLYEDGCVSKRRGYLKKPRPDIF